jgi:hypothetical protein
MKDTTLFILPNDKASRTHGGQEVQWTVIPQLLRKFPGVPNMPWNPKYVSFMPPVVDLMSFDESLTCCRQVCCTLRGAVGGGLRLCIHTLHACSEWHRAYPLTDYLLRRKGQSQLVASCATTHAMDYLPDHERFDSTLDVAGTSTLFCPYRATCGSMQNIAERPSLSKCLILRNWKLQCGSLSLHVAMSIHLVLLWVEHGRRCFTLYAHCDEFSYSGGNQACNCSISKIYRLKSRYHIFALYTDTHLDTTTGVIAPTFQLSFYLPNIPICKTY